MQINTEENQSRPLLSIKAEHLAEFQKLVTGQIEAAFRIPGYRGLWLDANDWSGEAANFMASRSAHTPSDLRNHVQRINHQIRQKDPEGVYGALLDLFIVLKERGRLLRARMLKNARSLLREAWYQQLYQQLDKGITELDALPLSHASILSKGYVGSHRLVEKIEAGPKHDWDSLQEARSHLEYGQVDQARSVLESAVMAGSLQPEIHEDLIEIYRRTNDKSNFLKMQRQLNTDDSSALRLWRELEAFFAEGER